MDDYSKYFTDEEEWCPIRCCMCPVLKEAKDRQGDDIKNGRRCAKAKRGYDDDDGNDKLLSKKARESNEHETAAGEPNEPEDVEDGCCAHCGANIAGIPVGDRKGKCSGCSKNTGNSDEVPSACWHRDDCYACAYASNHECQGCAMHIACATCTPHPHDAEAQENVEGRDKQYEAKRMMTGGCI